MNKATALRRLEALQELVERLPEDANVILTNPAHSGRVSVSVTEYTSVMGDEYEDSKPIYLSYDGSFFVNRFYQVGEVEINGRTLPTGYTLSRRVEVVEK